MQENDTLKQFLDAGLALFNEKKYLEAIKVYKTAFAIVKDIDKSSLGTLYTRLGNAYYHLDDKDKYIYYYEKNLKEFPKGQSLIFARLGHAYYLIDSDKSLEYYNKALNFSDWQIWYAVNKLFTMTKSSVYEQENIKEESEFESEKIKNKFFENIVKYTHEDKKIKDKKLNIGYLSSDCYNHIMMNYMIPIWENHNKEKFNFYIFNCSSTEDETTKKIKNLGFEVLNCSKLDCTELAETIYNKKIDILIDLGGYTHLKSFCALYKPAPIIMLYLGYLNTLGMKEVDYIITDKYAIPDDKAYLYTEKPLYLDKGYNIFSYSSIPDISENPFIKNGYITFGSFNCPSKINDTIIYMWCKILERVENSKLLIYRTKLNKTMIKNLKLKFAKFGIEENRIIYVNTKYSPLYHAFSLADISLDTYPFSGMSIAMQTALMGVPTVTLAGEGMQSKGAGRVNLRIGLSDLNADCGEAYIETAAKLANNKERLIELRNNLRDMVNKSDIMTKKEDFTRNLEDKFLEVWNNFLNAPKL